MCSQKDGHDGHGSHEPTITPPGAGASQAQINAYVAAIRAQPENAHVHDDDMSKMSEHMAAMDLAPRDEATHIAISDGDWFDPSTWHNGVVPGDNAKVLIPEGIHIEYGSVSDASLFTVRVDGTLDFDTDADSRMVFDTMLVSPSGCLVIGTQADPVDPNVSVELVVANNGPIDVDWDPMLLSRGIISHGTASIHGAAKDSHLKVTEDPMAGDTSVTFGEVPEGWQVGDKIVIAGTKYDGYKWDNAIGGKRLYEPEDEVRFISSIEGNTVFFNDPLEYDHDSPRDDLKTSVANYTRNVSVETEDAETAEIHERGHVMFMHSDDVDVRYAEFHELGRTDKTETSRGVDDFNRISSESNVQGRYSLHLHRTGVDNIDDPAIVVGNAVWGSPGWGYVHHDSNAVLENNASFDTVGAGYVAETGNETGAWNDNIAIQATGGWGNPKNQVGLSDTLFDTAKGGDGFWFQGRMVESSDNVAASVNNGFVYFHRGATEGMLESDAANFHYPSVLHYDDAVRSDDVPILMFDGNETFAARQGLHVVKANPDQGHDVWTHLNDFTAWSVQNGAEIEYTSHYLLTDFDVVAKEPTKFSNPDTGFTIGSNTSEVVIKDSTFTGFKTGIDLNKKFVGASQGQIDDHNYFVIDAQFRDVDNNYANYDPRYDTILNARDLRPREIDLELDGPLVYEEGRNIKKGGEVDIDGTKTDGLGETEFPGGTDTFNIFKSDVATILEEDGYWTTNDGSAYFLSDIYMTDRLTGDIYYETHAVYIEDDVARKLGERDVYKDAVYNGQQNITTRGGETYAGDTLLDRAIFAEQPTSQFAGATSEILWHALTAHSDPIPEGHMHDNMTEDELMSAGM
ncbi:MAG: G8 domain-containing protein [Pseudomonadota bacterium]